VEHGNENGSDIAEMTGRIACERCNLVTTVERKKPDDGRSWPMLSQVTHDNPEQGGCELRSPSVVYLDSTDTLRA
jgi:hypothetical protein